MSKDIERPLKSPPSAEAARDISVVKNMEDGGNKVETVGRLENALAGLESDIASVEADIETLPDEDRAPFQLEVRAIHNDVEATKAELDLAERAGKSAIVFRPRTELRPTLGKGRFETLGLTAIEDELPSTVVAERLGLSSGELLDRLNDVMQKEFAADPWHVRDITPKDMDALRSVDMNLASYGNAEFKQMVADHTDANGRLSRIIRNTWFYP